MLTRNQRYAARIFEHVSQVPEPERQKYGSMAHKLPILIRTAGLAQALAFADSRDVAEHKKLLDHIAQVVGLPDRSVLVKRSRTAELVDYMRLTHEVLDTLVWFKRFAQSVLGVEAGGEAEEGGGSE